MTEPPSIASVQTRGAATYDHALNAVRQPWRGIVSIVFLIIGYFVLSLAVGGIGLLIDSSSGVLDLDRLQTRALPLTPGVFLFTNLSLAVIVPFAMAIQRLFFGARAGTLASVTGHFRITLLWRLALVIVPVWAVYIGLGIITGPPGSFRIDGTAVVMLAIVVFTTPLQAAGEEFGARGLIQRSVGSWFRSPMVAFVVSTIVASGLFAAAHAARDPWLIAYYFVFGASMSIAARGTGGVEAPILIHATNNVLIFLPAVFLGQMQYGINRGVGAGGPYLLFPMVLCISAALFASWWARRNNVQITRSLVARRAAAPTPHPPSVDPNRR